MLMAAVIPLEEFFTQVVEPVLDTGTGESRDRDDLCMLIERRNIFLQLLQVKIKNLLGIDLVYQDAVRHLEHQRVFERFVVTLRDTEDHNFQIRTGVKLSRTDKISHILKENQIC